MKAPSLQHILSALSLTIPGSVHDNGPGITVATSEGAVRGIITTPKVRQFLGIPYASPTSGQNRYMPPQAAATRPDGDILDATEFGDACPQYLNTGFLELVDLIGWPGPVGQSENCLSLNIWAPSVNRKQNTAVMVWVHGGGLCFGTTKTSFYNGTTLVGDHDDITVVSINYRMSVFGFPTAPQITENPNVGLLDIDAAITWVYKNIKNFGGDPERVTLFGESAGGIAIDMYTYSHLDSPIVKGIILQSGTALMNSPPIMGSLLGFSNATDPSDPQSNWNLLSASVGCGTDNGPIQLACMQQKPFGELINITSSRSLSFYPSPDGTTDFYDREDRLAEGRFLKVPALIGTNGDEGSIFAIVREMVQFNTSNARLKQVLSDTIDLTAYSCLAARSAAGRANASVPVYRYRYEARFPHLMSRPDLGAYHTSEIPMVFGTYNSSPFPGSPTLTQVELSKYMQNAWVAFARNPTSGLEATDFKWPRYDPNWNSTTPTLVELGGQNPTGAAFGFPVAFDAGCAVATEAYLLLNGLLAQNVDVDDL